MGHGSYNLNNNSVVDTEVLIVGAGPVGLVQAAALARLGVSCRIADQSTRAVQTSNAVTIHARTLELLEPLGLTDLLIRHGVWIRSVEFNGGGRVLAQLQFSSLKSNYQGLLSLPQSVTEQLFGKSLVEYGVVVERPVKLISFVQNSHCVDAVLEHNDGSRETVRAHYLIGCDGARSTVRKALGVELENLSEPQNFIMADVRISWSLSATQLSVFLHRDGPLLTIPMPEERYRIIVENEASASPGEELSFEKLRTLFAKRVPVAATLSDMSFLVPYRAKRSRVTTYKIGRVLIAGEAAHTNTPANGQSMNTGIQDALNLAWKLALVEKNKATDSLLASYSAERVPVAGATLVLSNQMMQPAAFPGAVVDRLRTIALPLLAGFDFFQQNLFTELSEIGLHYRDSPIVQGSGSFPAHAPHPGDRAPISPLNGQTLDKVLQPAVHNLLLFAGPSASREQLSWLFSVRRNMQAAYPGLICGSVISHGSALPEFETVSDTTDGRTHAEYGASQPCLYLIRPDYYIGYRAATPDSAALHQFLKEAYGFTAMHQAAGG